MNYIGSKISLLSFIDETIKDVTGYDDNKGYVFADLFAGTGSVGKYYKTKGWDVISNDIQQYSYVLNKHWICNNTNTTASNIKEIEEYFNNLPIVDGFVCNNYCSNGGRNYFTNENGGKCDTIRQEIDHLMKNNLISDNEYYWYLASLLDNVDKCANTASVYISFLKHIKKTASNVFTFQLLPIIDGNIGKVFCGNANNLIKTIAGDVLYLDPPYNSRQYCAYYHVLETIARNDNPTVKGITGQRDYSSQKSAYCSSKTALENLDDLLANANFTFVFMSYNNEGIMSLEDIKQVMSKYGFYERREIQKLRYSADSNRDYKASQTVEYIHCLRKR